MANDPITQNSQRYQFKHQLDIGDEFLPPLQAGGAAPNYGKGAQRASPTTGILEYWNGSAWIPYTAALGGGLVDVAGNGDPNGVVTGAAGSRYTQLDGVAGSLLWIKQSAGTGNTGWNPIA